MSIPYGYVYRIRNKINGKTYVGQRKLSLDKKWRQYMGSGVAIKASIVKYGIDNFTKELLAYAASYDELNKIEVDLIRKERHDGKAQYNLHIGSPVPQNSGGFKNLTPEELEVRYADLAQKNRERHRHKYEETIETLMEDIISLYNKYGNCKTVADELAISIKYVNRYLKESGIRLNHQNIKGRILDEEAKKRISDGLRNSPVRFQLICNTCGILFGSRSLNRTFCEECTTEKIITKCKECHKEFEHDIIREPKFCSSECSCEARKKELPPIEVIESLYWEENLSANKIGQRFSVSGQTIRNYMKKNNVDRRAERHHL